MDNELKILISGILNLSSTEKTLDQQLKELSGKLDSIKLKVEFDESTLAIFKKMSDNIEKMASSAKSALKEETRVVEETITEFQKLDGSIEKTTQKILKNGQVIRQTRIKNKEQIDKETESINEQRKSLEDLIDENDRYNKSISDTIRRTAEGEQKSARYVYGQDGTANRFAINTDAENIPTGTVETINALKNQQMAEKAREEHLATVRRNMLQEENDTKNFIAEMQKQYDKLVAITHKGLLDEENEWNRFIAKQQKDFQDYQQKIAKTQLQIDSMKKTYAADPKALESLKELETNLKAITPGNHKQQFENLSNEIKRVGIESDISGKSVLKLNEAFRIALSRTVVWMGAMTAFYFPLRQFEAGIKQVYELDTAMTDLKKVTNESNDTYKQFALDANKTAASVGALTVDVIKSSTEWARLGYNIKQAQALAKETLVYQNVGDIKSAEDASQSLISTIKGFGIEVDDQGKNVTKIVDLYNNIGNKFAISSAGIGEAMRRASASLYQSGNTIEQAVALITAANTTIQDPASVGTALKTVAMRIQGISDDGEDLTNLVPTLEKQFNALGLTLKKNDNTFKSTYEIFSDLAGVWKNLSNFQQANIVELVAGKRQGNVVTSMLNNWRDATNALQQGLNSAGSAAQENAVFMDSLQGKVQKFRNTVTGFWQDSLNTQALKNLVDLGTGLVNLLTKIVDNFGLMPPIVALTTTALFTFNKTALATFNNMLTKIPATRAEIIALTSTVDASSLAIKGMSLAFAAMNVLLPVALITGLSFALSQFMTSSSEAKQKADELSSSFKQNASDLENKIDSLKKLSDEYESLQSKTSKTTQETDRLNQIEKDLVNTYGVSITGISAQGEAYANNTEVIKLRIKELEKQKQLEQDNLKNSVIGNSDQTQESLGKDLKNIEFYQQKITQTQTLVDNLKNSISNNGETGVQLPSGIITKDLEYMKRLLPEYEKELGYWRTKNQEFYTNLSKDSANLLQVLTNDLEENGKNFNEKTKLVGKNMAKELSLQKAPSTKVIDFFNKVMMKDLNDFDKLAKKYDEISGKINENPLDENLKSQLNEVTIGMGKILNAYTNLNPTQEKIFGEFKEEFMNMLNAATKTKDSLLDVVDVQKELNTAFDSTASAVKPLNDAIDKMQQGHSLTSSEVANLLKKYPDLIQSFTDENGVLKIGVDALEAKRDAEIDAFNSTIELEQKKVEAQKTALSERLSIYAADIQAIDSVVKAKQLELKVFQDSQNAFHEGGVQGPGFVPKADLDSIEAIGKAADSIKALQTVAQAGFKFENSINTPNSDNKNKTFDPYVVDQYAHAIANLDIKISDSQQRQATYNETSAEYRQEIQNQIELIQKKQRLAAEEEGRLKGVNVELEQQRSKLSSSSEEYSNLTQKIDENDKQVESLTNNIIDWQKSIDSTSKSLSDLSEKGLKDLIDNATKAKKAVEDVNKEIADTQKQLASQMNSLADDIISLEKEVLEARKQGELNAIQLTEDGLDKQRNAEKEAHAQRTKELDAIEKKYESIYDAQIKQIDDQDSEAKFKQDLADKHKEELDLQKKLNIAKLNNDTANKKDIEDLEKKLADKRKDISNFVASHDKDVRKRSLQDALDAQKKELDSQKDAIQQKEDSQDKAYQNEKDNLEKLKKLRTQYYDDQINDDKKFAAIREQVLNGDFSQILANFTQFKVDLQSNSSMIGKILADNLISKITEMQGTISKVTASMGGMFGGLSDIIKNDFITNLDSLITKLHDLNNVKLDNLKTEFDSVNSIIDQMKSNSLAWFNTDAAGQAALATQNESLAKQLISMGINVTKKDGDWFLPNGKKLYDMSPSDIQAILNQKANTNPVRSFPGGFIPIPTANPSAPTGGNSAPSGMTDVPSSSFTPLPHDDNLPPGFGGGYHTGTAGSNPTPLGKALHKMFNLNQHEEMAKLLKSEPVINTAQFRMATFANLMSAVVPKFSGAKSETNSNNVTLNLNIENMHGTKKDVDFVFTEIRKGMNSLGLRYST
jgi:TP901 family phage tail tape measure protein